MPDARMRMCAAVLVATMACACRAPAGEPAPSFVLDETPALLLEPEVWDWTSQRLSSSRLALARQAQQRKLMAFPSGTGSFVGGKALTDYGCTATDFVPNGPAASMILKTLLFLTKEGRLVRVDRSNPATFKVLNLGKTFTRTAITLSFNSTRAYLIADDGTFFVVNYKDDMSVMTSLSLGAAFGCAPFSDPYTSTSRHDDVWVPTNDGKVHKLRFTTTATAPFYSQTGPTAYNVATSVTPLSGTRKVAAPPIVLDGVIYLGDQGGSLRVFDTKNTANNLTFGVGAPINTAPAIEIQDGTYTIRDQNGAIKTVGIGKPIYAFVGAGGTCAWLDLHALTTTFSLPLRIDDNETTRKFGFLRDYSYSTGGTTQYLAAQDGGNINTESPDQTLPGTSPATIWSNNHLVPAETNTRLDASGNNAAGGPVISYLRWAPASAPTAGSVLVSAELGLRCAFDQPCRVPEVRTTSHLYANGTGPWVSNALTNANRPPIGSTSVGVYTSGGVLASGNVDYRDNRCYFWDVTKAFSGPQSAYALALKHEAGGDAVLWPEGPVGGGTGKKAKRASQVEAVKFVNNPLNANPAAASGAICTGSETRPILKLVISTAQLPTPSIETAPVIDAITKKAYVFYTNALYEIDFATPARWADTETTKRTLFNLAYWGDSVNGGGGTFWTKRRYVGNYTAPAMAYDGSAMYMLNRYPNPNNVEFPTTWGYALSKMTLPLSATANRLVAASPTFTGIEGAAKYDGTAKEASTFLVVDPFTNASTTGGNIWFALGNGKIYQYDR